MDAEKMIEFRAPNTKETSNPKLQRPGVRGLRVCSFRFGTWNFFGVWSLEFGILCAVALFLTGCLTDEPIENSSTAKPGYPFTRKTNVVEDYHGVKVADPYRWLEDDNSPETKAWAEAENKVTFGYLERIADRPAIKERF